jgi:hypothetical protein
MNIFRILAQGDGSINEPNVSAFLGYLLNPNEDHGLGSVFLQKFLYQHYLFLKKNNENVEFDFYDNKNGFNTDFGINSNYEVRVFFEQAFAGEDKKEIVDIMLLIHEVHKENKESEFVNYLTNKRKLKHVFLIEVKIKDSATKIGKGDKEGQLDAQIYNSKQKLKSLLSETHEFEFNLDKNISIIFVTPEGDQAIKAFDILKNKVDIPNPKSHIFWRFKKDDKGSNIEEYELEANEEEPKSIELILDSIIYPSFEDKIEAIPQYTHDTIKSFSNFIYSDFSYKIKQKIKGISTGDFFEVHNRLNIEYNVEENLNKIKTYLEEKLSTYNLSILKPNLNRVKHPELCIDINDVYISIYAGNSKRDRVKIIFKLNKKRKDSFQKLENIRDKWNSINQSLKIEIKSPNYVNDTCLYSPIMGELVNIDDFEKISEVVKHAIEISK